MTGAKTRKPRTPTAKTPQPPPTTTQRSKQHRNTLVKLSQHHESTKAQQQLQGALSANLLWSPRRSKADYKYLLVVGPERRHSVEGLGKLREDGGPRDALEPLQVTVYRPVVHLEERQAGTSRTRQTKTRQLRWSAKAAISPRLYVQVKRQANRGTAPNKFQPRASPTNESCVLPKYCCTDFTQHAGLRTARLSSKREITCQHSESATNGTLDQQHPLPCPH